MTETLITMASRGKNLTPGGVSFGQVLDALDVAGVHSQDLVEIFLPDSKQSALPTPTKPEKKYKPSNVRQEIKTYLRSLTSIPVREFLDDENPVIGASIEENLQNIVFDLPRVRQRLLIEVEPSQETEIPQKGTLYPPEINPVMD